MIFQKHIFILILIIFLFTGCNDKKKYSPKLNSHRLIVTYRPAVHLVMALKKYDCLVGIHKTPQQVGLFKYLLPDLDQLPIVGSKIGDLNLETAVSLNPTLVVSYPGTKGIAVAKSLKRFNIPSFLVQIETIRDIQTTLKKLADKLDATENANVVIGQMNKILSIVDKNLDGNLGKKKSIYFSSSRNFLTTHSHQMLQHEMILKACARDVSTVKKGGWANISLEQLILWNPDIIVISDSSNFSVNSILNNRRYSHIEAVKKGKVFRMPEKKICAWDFPGPDVVLGILWLARLCYPARFKSLDWESLKEEYYQKIYNVSYSTLKNKGI